MNLSRLNKPFWDPVKIERKKNRLLSRGGGGIYTHPAIRTHDEPPNKKKHASHYVCEPYMVLITMRGTIGVAFLLAIFFLTRGGGGGVLKGTDKTTQCRFRNSHGKIPVAIPQFPRWKTKQNKKHRHSTRRGLVFLMMVLPLFNPHLATLLWLIHRDSRHPRESPPNDALFFNTKNNISRSLCNQGRSHGSSRRRP